MRSVPVLGGSLVVVAAMLGGACNSTLGPPTASVDNVVDTVTLYALTGTPVGSPSAYSIEGPAPSPVRTDSVPAFDFAFDLVGGRALVYPQGALPGLSRSSALQYGPSFDGVTTAPGAGWNDTTALTVDVGTPVVVRSRAILCDYGATVYEYAKMEILAVDTTARTVNFRILADVNCGYRDLNVGIPTH